MPRFYKLDGYLIRYTSTQYLLYVYHDHRVGIGRNDL